MSRIADLVASKKVAIGTLVSSTCSLATEAISLSGMDFIFIDAEHAPIGIGVATAMVQSVSGRCLSFIRTADAGVTCIKQALDTGCDGIIVPQVNSAEMARSVSAAAKYPPLGERSVGISRAHGFGKTFSAYLHESNQAVSLFVQIEHIAAVNDIENICRVPGVDGIFIGPYDLSGSLGKPGQVTDADVQEAVSKAIDAGKQAGKLVGAFGANESAGMALLAKGVNVLAVGTDLGRLMNDCERTVASLRAATPSR
jgi:2-keto-3-deoxy-L-rhamnonate aldolase RhmA